MAPVIPSLYAHATLHIKGITYFPSLWIWAGLSTHFMLIFLGFWAQSLREMAVTLQLPKLLTLETLPSHNPVTMLWEAQATWRGHGHSHNTSVNSPSWVPSLSPQDSRHQPAAMWISHLEHSSPIKSWMTTAPTTILWRRDTTQLSLVNPQNCEKLYFSIFGDDLLCSFR